MQKHGGPYAKDPNINKVAGSNENGCEVSTCDDASLFSESILRTIQARAKVAQRQRTAVLVILLRPRLAKPRPLY